MNKIYQHIISGTQHNTPFNTADESTEDTDSIWTLFLHTGIYVMAMGSFIEQDWEYFAVISLVSTCQISVLTFTTR